MKVEQSSNYGKFIPDVHNREVRKIDKISASMKQYGWIPAYPMHVVKKDGVFVILDGQHRFEAAKQLGIAVLYVVCNDDSVQISSINNAQSPWSLKDYLGSFVKQGKPAYIELSDYVARTGIGLTQAVSMFSGEIATSGNQNGKFRSGLFEIKNKKLPELVASIIAELRKDISWACDNLLVAAVSRACCVPEFDASQFVAKAHKKQSMMRRCATLDQYTDMMEELYNWHSQDPVPLKFLCEKAMRKRTFSFNKRDK